MAQLLTELASYYHEQHYQEFGKSEAIKMTNNTQRQARLSAYLQPNTDDVLREFKDIGKYNRYKAEKSQIVWWLASRYSPFWS